MVGLMVAVSGCSWVIKPKGEPAERAKAASAGRAFNHETLRPLPVLSTTTTLSGALEYAFLSSGEILMAYREWLAALERVPQAGALMDPRLNFNFIFAPVNMKDFAGILNNVFNEIGFMLEQEIPGKGKRPARAQKALAEAKAAGERFRAAKFMVQSQVVGGWAALELNEALQKQMRENINLLTQAREVVLHRYHVGSEMMALPELRKMDVEIEQMESDLRMLEIEHPRRVAELNKPLNRPVNAPFGPMAATEIQPPSLAETDLFERAARNNPQLAEIHHEIEARGADQVLAELEKRPDYMISGGIMAQPMADGGGGASGGGMGKAAKSSGGSGGGGSGGVKTAWMPSLGLSMTLPINRERIRAMIAETLAMHQAAEARLRASHADVLTRVIISLVMLRDADRITTDYEKRIIPRTRELIDAQLAQYGAGGGEILDILDSERMLVDFRKLIAQARADRLRAYGELEEAVGEDLFKFMPGGGNAANAKEPRS